MEEYYGRYSNVLDAKGRINMPARFREIAEKEGNGDQVFILTRGTERYVAMFPFKEWRRKVRELEREVTDGKKRRILKRRLNYFASHQKVDKQGRINIPSELIDYASLEKDVVVVGTGRMIEIWNPRELEKYLKQAETEFQSFSDLMDF